MPEQLDSGQDSFDDHGAGPAAAPAFALVGPDGALLEATEAFLSFIGATVLSVPGVYSAVSDVTGGNQELAVLRVDGADARQYDARAEAVLGPGERRLALMEAMVPRPPAGLAAAPSWLSRFVGDSPAIIWVKDLDGHYVYVNAEYSRQLRVTIDDVYGRDDAELSQVAAIDAPRSRGKSTAEEPRQLEYTIPAFDRRPAFAALRFPLLQPDGQALAVCGIASPADHPEIAQRECARMLDIARWFRGDASDLRRSVLRDWDVRALHPQGAIELLVDDRAEAASAELLEAGQRTAELETANAELESRIRELQRQVALEHQRAVDTEASLTDARGRADALAASLEITNARLSGLEAAHSRIRDLESMVATAGAAGVAAAESAKRVTELEAEVRQLSARLEQERQSAERTAARTQAEWDSIRSDREHLAGEREAAQARIEALEAALVTAQATEAIVDVTTQELQGAQERAAAAGQRARDAERRAEEAEQRARDAERRAEEAEQRAEAAERRIGEVELRATHAEERADSAERRAEGAQDRAQVAERRAADAEWHSGEHRQHAREAEGRAAELERRLGELEASLGDAAAADLALADARGQIGALERRIEELQATVARAPVPAPASRDAVPTSSDPRPATPQEPAAPAPSNPTVSPATGDSAPAAAIVWDPAARTALAGGLRGCASLRSILSESVRLVGSRGGWDAAVAWTLDQREAAWACTATWMRSPMEMARLETSMWQVRQDPGASAIGAAARARDIIWVTDPGADGDRHLAAVRSEGMHTVVLVPIREGDQILAVLELCTAGHIRASAASVMDMRSIVAEIAAANRRVVAADTSAGWGRRRRR